MCPTAQQRGYSCQDGAEVIIFAGFYVVDSDIPDSKVHGVNMGPIWDRQDPGGHHVGHRNLAI